MDPQILHTRLFDRELPTNDRLDSLRLLQKSNLLPEEKTRIIYRLLHEDAPKKLQIYAVLAMAASRDASTVQKLQSMLESENDGDVERAILATLAQLSGTNLIPFLLERLESSNAQSRRAAIFVAVRFRDSRTEEAILKALNHDADQSVRVLAAIALARWGRTEGADILQSQIRRMFLESEFSCICALCSINQKAGFQELAAILDKARKSLKKKKVT